MASSHHLSVSLRSHCVGKYIFCLVPYDVAQILSSDWIIISHVKYHPASYGVYCLSRVEIYSKSKRAAKRRTCWGDRSTRILTVFGKRPGSAKVVDPGHAQ